MRPNRTLPLLVGTVALAIGLGGAQVYALDLSPSTSGVVLGSSLTPPTNSSNCEPGCVYRAFGLPNDGSLSLLYKANQGTTVTEAGTFAANYSTVFNSDASGGTIRFTGGSSISCPPAIWLSKMATIVPPIISLTWRAGTEQRQSTSTGSGLVLERFPMSRFGERQAPVCPNHLPCFYLVPD